MAERTGEVEGTYCIEYETTKTPICGGDTRLGLTIEEAVDRVTQLRSPGFCNYFI